MVASLRQLVTVQPGGVVRIQSDLLRAGTVADVLITTAAPLSDSSLSNLTWAAFIGAGSNTGRTVEEIDASIRALRDEWS